MFGLISLNTKPFYLDNKESLEDVRPIWERAIFNYEKGIKVLEGLGEKNTAAHMMCNLATLYTLAANAVCEEGQKVPFTKQEMDYHNRVCSS